jgi:hypothetical protein
MEHISDLGWDRRRCGGWFLRCRRVLLQWHGLPTVLQKLSLSLLHSAPKKERAYLLLRC